MDKEHQANEPTIFKVSNKLYKMILKNFQLIWIWMKIGVDFLVAYQFANLPIWQISI